MEQEKDNFWLYIGLLIAAVIFGVFLLKGRETEHLARTTMPDAPKSSSSSKKPSRIPEATRVHIHVDPSGLSLLGNPKIQI